MRNKLWPSLFLIAVFAGCSAPTPPKPSSPQVPPPKETARPGPSAPTPGTGPSYTLRVKEKKGAKWSYTWVDDTTVDPVRVTDPAVKKAVPDKGSAHLEGVLKVEVNDVQPNRTTYTLTSQAVKVTGTGIWKKQAEDPQTKAPGTSHFTWDDRMTNVKKGDYQDPLTNSFNGLFPEGPVQVGSSWEYDPFPEIKKYAQAKVLAVEKFRGKDTLKIEIRLPETFPGEKRQIIVWMDPTNGRYQKCEMHLSGDQAGVHTTNDFQQVINP